MNRIIFSLVHISLCFCICGCVSSGQKQHDVAAFDDFNGRFNLNWEIQGNDPSCWSLSKTAGTLTITTENGTFTRNRTDYKNIFLIDRPTNESQDFQVTTCLTSFEPVGIWNQAGLILWSDEDNNLKFVYEYEDDKGPPAPHVINQRVLAAAIEIGGNATHIWFRAEQEPGKIWLRLIKRGNRCELLVGTDGKSFQPVKVIIPVGNLADHCVPWPEVPLRYVGIFANNGSAYNAPTVDASFDFFEVKVLSEKPEDTTFNLN